MTFVFGSKPYFNIGSPTNSSKIVKKIVDDFLLSRRSSELKAVRVLDVGGTPYGFQKKAFLPPDSIVTLVNPDVVTGAKYSYLEDVPTDIQENGYDLVMMMGMLMFLPPSKFQKHFHEAHARLKKDSWLLIAEPNPARIAVRVDHLIKNYFCRIRGMPPYTAYTLDDVREALLNAGFTRFEVRPDLAGKTVESFLFRRCKRYYVIAACS